MSVKPLLCLLSVSLMSTMLHANPAYLSGMDESAEANRQRFISQFAGENADDLTRATFEKAAKKQADALFAKNKTLTEAQFINYYQNLNDIELAKSREGQIRQTKVRFQAIDVDKDGFIDLKEFQEIGLKSFERYDNNKDGWITMDDDQKAVEAGAQQKDGERLTPRVKHLLTMPTTHNAQGFIALAGEGRNRLSLADYLKTREQQFQRTDTNQDGKVDLKEYEAEFLGRVDQEIEKVREAQAVWLKMRFAAIDANHDGKIDRQEWNQFAANNFAYWDTNQDAKVSVNEALPQ